MARTVRKSKELERQKQAVRLGLQRRAKEAAECAELHRRIKAVVTSFGYLMTHPSLPKIFDVFLASEVADYRDREKILRRLFSRRGGSVKVTDRVYVEAIEKSALKFGK